MCFVLFNLHVNGLRVPRNTPSSSSCVNVWTFTVHRAPENNPKDIQREPLCQCVVWFLFPLIFRRAVCERAPFFYLLMPWENGPAADSEVVSRFTEGIMVVTNNVQSPMDPRIVDLNYKGLDWLRNITILQRDTCWSIKHVIMCAKFSLLCINTDSMCVFADQA